MLGIGVSSLVDALLFAAVGAGFVTVQVKACVVDRDPSEAVTTTL